MRDDRRREAEEHVQNVNRMLKGSAAAGAIEEEELLEENGESEAWEGFPDQADLGLVGEEEEYLDEDRFTTVTVESVSISRDGLEKSAIRETEEPEHSTPKTDDGDTAPDASQAPKKKKKKFRYETKFERQLGQNKQRIKRAKR